MTMTRGQQEQAKQLIILLQPLMREDVQVVMDHAEASSRELGVLLECSHETARTRRVEIYTCLRKSIEFAVGMTDD